MTLGDLGRRAVACKHWQWMPGMWILFTATNGKPGYTRIIHASEDWDGFDVVDESFSKEDVMKHGVIPDFSDPATLGCLLALVREAWGQDDMGAFRYKSRWCVEHTSEDAQCAAFYGDTEAEALVAALEAAP